MCVFRAFRILRDGRLQEQPATIRSATPTSILSSFATIRSIVHILPSAHQSDSG